MPTVPSTKTRIRETAACLFELAGLGRPSIRALCAEAAVSTEEFYSAYPGGAAELQSEMLAPILRGFAETIPDRSGNLFADLVLFAEKYQRHFHENRSLLLASLSEILVNGDLQRLLQDEQAQPIVFLTHWMAAYRSEGAWHERYDRLPMDDLEDRLAISFLAGIIAREILAAFGVASERFVPEEHVTEWLYGVARSSREPVDVVQAVFPWLIPHGDMLGPAPLPQAA